MSMTTKEAIHCMKSYLPEATDEDCRNCPFYGSMKTYDPQIFLCKSSEAHKMAIDALEKQVPKKAIGEHYAHMRCPSCNHRIPSGAGSSSRRRDNWCNYCGQKIDWEET